MVLQSVVFTHTLIFNHVCCLCWQYAPRLLAPAHWGSSSKTPAVFSYWHPSSNLLGAISVSLEQTVSSLLASFAPPVLLVLVLFIVLPTQCSIAWPVRLLWRHSQSTSLFPFTPPTQTCAETSEDSRIPVVTSQANRGVLDILAYPAASKPISLSIT